MTLRGHGGDAPVADEENGVKSHLLLLRDLDVVQRPHGQGQDDEIGNKVKRRRSDIHDLYVPTFARDFLIPDLTYGHTIKRRAPGEGEADEPIENPSQPKLHPEFAFMAKHASVEAQGKCSDERDSKIIGDVGAVQGRLDLWVRRRAFELKH